VISLYLSGNTWLHRIPAAIKLAGLALASLSLLFVQQWIYLLPLLPLLALAYGSMGKPGWQRLLGLRALMLLILGLGVFQGLLMDWDRAASAVIKMVVMVMFADLITMTTPMQRMADVLNLLLTPLDRPGNFRRQIALAVALVMRFIPMLAQQWQAQHLAFRARTSRRPKPFLLAVFLTQAMRRTDQIAESIAAREAKRH
jgi:biotin transport system permease protein